MLIVVNQRKDILRPCADMYEAARLVMHCTECAVGETADARAARSWALFPIPGEMIFQIKSSCNTDRTHEDTFLLKQ